MINKIAVVGSRNFCDYSFFVEKLEHLISNLENIEFVSGGCKSGADNMIATYCKNNRFKLTEYLPDWEKHKKSAGIIRNKLIINDATHVIAFWDGSSKGTLDTIKRAEKKSIKMKLIKEL